jgi:hypothetical protein
MNTFTKLQGENCLDCPHAVVAPYQNMKDAEVNLYVLKSPYAVSLISTLQFYCVALSHVEFYSSSSSACVALTH